MAGENKRDAGGQAAEGDQTTQGGGGYAPPRILWEEPFEPVAIATSCGLYPYQGGSCDLTPTG